MYGSEASRKMSISDDIERAIQEVISQVGELTGNNVRVWRYVESQQALFGFLATDNRIGTADQSGHQRMRPFRDFVAFLHDSPIIERNAGGVLTVTGPFWEIRPRGSQLPEAKDNARVRVLLKIPSDPIATENLLGVVWFDDNGGEPGEEIDRQLATLRERLHTFSLLQFDRGFRQAYEFIRNGGDSAPETINEKTVEKQLKILVGNLDAMPSEVSIYVRRIDHEASAAKADDEKPQANLSTPLIAGVGDLYKLLHRVEERLEAEKAKERRIKYYQSMFGQHAYGVLRKQIEKENEKATRAESGEKHDSTESEGVFFPGGGDARDFDEHEGWLQDAQQTLIRDIGNSVELEWSAKMIEHGSFGSFPIRWSTGKGTQGPLVGLLCVASRDLRHFFTWTRRLMLEQFCHWLGRQHSDLAPFLDSVNTETHKHLMSSLDILRRVAPRSILVAGPAKEEQQCLAFVLSVDIRKSTDLMAKMVPAYARRYGDVLIGLWNKMKTVVQEEYGIFDKFTGDGILAYFPDFFEASCESAALRLLRSVERCHDAFLRSYPDLWEALSAVPAMANPFDKSGGGVGLGIGLDFGAVRLVNVGTELTIVGAPVVYACRLASAAWGFTTLANHPCHRAFKQLGVLDVIDSELVSIAIKHEDIHAYRITKRSWLKAPDWRMKDRDETPWDDGWLSDEAAT